MKLHEWILKNCKFAGKQILQLPPVLRQWIDQNLDNIVKKSQEMTARPSTDTLKRRTADIQKFRAESEAFIGAHQAEFKQLADIGEVIYNQHMNDEEGKKPKYKPLEYAVQLSTNTITVKIDAYIPGFRGGNRIRRKNNENGSINYILTEFAKYLLPNEYDEKNPDGWLKRKVDSLISSLLEAKVFSYKDFKQPLEMNLGTVQFINPYDKQQWSCTIYLNKQMTKSSGVQVNEDLKNRQLLIRLSAPTAAFLGRKFEDTIVHELVHAIDPKVIRRLEPKIKDNDDKAYWLQPSEFDARMAEIGSSLRRLFLNHVQAGGNGLEWVQQQRQRATSTPMKTLVTELRCIDPRALDLYFADPKLSRAISQKYVQALSLLQGEFQ